MTATGSPGAAPSTRVLNPATSTARTAGARPPPALAGGGDASNVPAAPLLPTPPQMPASAALRIRARICARATGDEGVQSQRPGAGRLQPTFSWFAPPAESTTVPLLHNCTSGREATFSRSASSSSSDTSTRANWHRPACAASSSSSSGVTFLHSLHHCAQRGGMRQVPAPRTGQRTALMLSSRRATPVPCTAPQLAAWRAQ